MEAVIQNKRLQQQSEQRSKGQFFTEAPICDLMLALTLQTGTEKLLEPGCGAGAFLLSAAECMDKKFSRSAAQIAEQLYGVELDPVAHTQAVENCKSAGLSKPLQLLQTDFLSSAIDDLGLFDVIIGNPPYVRHEMVKQSLHMDKSAAHVYLQEKYKAYLTQFPEQQSLLSQKADLYIWFFLQAATLLKPGGRLAFITSNSWLNAAFGKSFCQFLMQQFDLRFLIESTCERWFLDAAVNSVIVILDKKDPSQKKELPPVKVIQFHQPLTQWLSERGQDDYWQALDAQLDAMNYTETINNSAWSVRTISAEQFENKKASRHSSHHYWTMLMRAPKALLNLLKKPSCWTTLGQVGNVRYPIKTGINRFFYLNRKQAAERQIEPQFLHPVVKSIRQLETYRIDSKDCETLLFSCQEPEGTLQAKGLIQALKYIEWGSQQVALPRQKRAVQVPWPQVPSVQNRIRWYAIAPLSSPHILCSRFYDRRFFFPVCDGNVMEDQTFYGVTLPEGTQPTFIAALLNSTLTMGILEFWGRTNLGEGVLQFSRGDMAALPLPSPALYTAEEQREMMTAFERMSQRKVYPVAEEVLLADRQQLDVAVLKPLLKAAGCETPVESFRQSLIDSLLARMQQRAVMAGS